MLTWPQGLRCDWLWGQHARLLFPDRAAGMHWDRCVQRHESWRAWRFAESHQKQHAGGLLARANAPSLQCLHQFSNPSNLIRVVCEVVRMLQAGACDERPRTSWWLKLFVWVEEPQHKEDSVLRELINANFVNTHTHRKVLSTAQLWTDRAGLIFYRSLIPLLSGSTYWKLLLMRCPSSCFYSLISTMLHIKPVLVIVFNNPPPPV